MIKNVVRVIAVIHISAVIIAIWLRLFDLIHLNAGQAMAMFVISIIGALAISIDGAM